MNIAGSVRQNGTKRSLSIGSLLSERDDGSLSLPLDQIYDFVKQLTPQNCLIEHCSQSAWERRRKNSFTEDSEKEQYLFGLKKEKWYGVDYYLTSIDQNTVQEWNHVPKSQKPLHLPKENQYIPTDLSLCSELPEEATKHPRIDKEIEPPNLLINDKEFGKFDFCEDDIDFQYMDMFASTVSDLASKMFDYYQSNLNTNHTVNIQCSYGEIIRGVKKKCSIKDLSFIVSCDKYPKTTVFQEIHGITHEFLIIFKLLPSEGIKYIENNNGSIDIHINVLISIYEYLKGSHRTFKMYGKEYDITIQAFSKKTVELKEKNIEGNRILCHIKPRLPTKEDMDLFSEEEYMRFIELIKKL